ncbi:MAG: ribonucleoside hydrolase RihC [Defluviitaleaceae bacterium]|nr:ribonucleoside hydrolase RihC [Defluviitaleaceae bacterium]
MIYEKRKIIIDTDPGIDDAVALALALFSDKLDVKLISTVSGNVSLEKVTLNTLKLLNLFDKNIPVAKGSTRPLIKKAIDASDIHGETGMDGYDFKQVDESLIVKQHAVEAIRNVITENIANNSKITIVAIGPLTNIALAIRTYPEIIYGIEELVIMGGSLGRGNSGVLSEFNFDCDAEAAKIVFDTATESGMKVTVTPLDVGLKALVYPEESEQIKNMNIIGDMFYHLFKKYRGGSFGTGLKMYDSCAIAYILCPECFTIERTYVDIETTGTLTYGASIIDLRNYMKKPANARVCIDINENIFKQWFMKSIAEFNIN